MSASPAGPGTATAPTQTPAAAMPHATVTATGVAQRVTARIAVLGAGGYAGQEFVRLALAHPGLELAQLVSREHAGRPAHQWLVGLAPRALPPAVAPERALHAVCEGAVDTLVVCLPHGAWRARAPEFEAAARQPLRIV